MEKEIILYNKETPFDDIELIDGEISHLLVHCIKPVEGEINPIEVISKKTYEWYKNEEEIVYPVRIISVEDINSTSKPEDESSTESSNTESPTEVNNWYPSVRKLLTKRHHVL